MYNITVETFKKIRDILNKHDPVSLVAEGCPEDEYDPEVSRIIQVDSSALTVQEFGLKIYEIFVVMFEEENAGDKEKYIAIAQEIKDSINK